MNLKNVFETRGYRFLEFSSAEESVGFLCDSCRGKTVSFGGSVTLEQIGLYDALKTDSECFWHWRGDTLSEIGRTQVYISSVNAVSISGELVNIDGCGNRISASIYGSEEVFFVFGENKLCPDLPSALDRAQNVAAPQNAKRLHRNTPCAADGICHHCQSPDCICCVTSVFRRKPSSCPMTLILIRESLGY